jgi:hypothetical protein
MRRITITAFIITTLILCASLCGCKSTVITIPRETLPPVKIVDQRLLYWTSAKDMYVYVDEESAHVEVGQVRSVSDPNSIEALGGALGNVVGSAVKGF